MVKLIRLQHLGVKSSVGRSLSRSAVRREFVRIGDEGGGPSGHQMDRIHGGNISPARQFMRLRSGSVGSDTVRLGLPKKGTPADYLNMNTAVNYTRQEMIKGDTLLVSGGAKCHIFAGTAPIRPLRPPAHTRRHLTSPYTIMHGLWYEVHRT